MRKQGLVHLHALCTLLREHLQNRSEFEASAFDCANGTASPAAIHRPKAEHRRAVDELATEIAAAVDPDSGGDHSSGSGSTDSPGDPRTVPDGGCDSGRVDRSHGGRGRDDSG
jgi:hypothetical protein